jgi:hypothetical protein
MGGMKSQQFVVLSDGGHTFARAQELQFLFRP